MKSSSRIKVDYLARVEGEGGIMIKFKDGTASEARFNIFEPPRFFEAFLRGRSYSEAPDITARICGICPIAHSTSACQAVEAAFGARLDGPLRALRRLIFLGEWIESHALHIYMLHAPDFLGYQDVVELARDHPEIVQRGLQLKKLGNDLVALVGGREIHPVNLKAGGFYRIPTQNELLSLVDRIKWARDAAYETVRWTAKLTFPEFDPDSEFVALHHTQEYAILEGDLVSNRGLHVPINGFEQHIQEEHVEHATSLQATIKGRGEYVVGPLARFNLNFDQLSAPAREAAREVGLAPGCTNPFKSIIIRSIETLQACDESLRIIASYEMPPAPAVELKPVAGDACGCTEAPRGICWHRYRLDDAGAILEARIVPPTSQIQKAIEKDLLYFVRQNSDLPDETLSRMCEQVVRNYDPCISCACHFLKVRFDREQTNTTRSP